MAIDRETLLAHGTELLGWSTATPEQLELVLADLKLLEELHQRTLLEATAVAALELNL